MDIVQKLAIATAGVALSFASLESLPACAAIITYDFTVKDVTGALSTKTFSGSFSFDDSDFQRKGSELTGSKFGILDGSPAPDEFNGKVKFNFDFMGKTFTELDEESGQVLVFFENGEPTQIVYRSEQYANSYEGTPYFFIFSATGGTDAEGNSLPPRAFEYQFDGGMGQFAEAYGIGEVVFMKRNEQLKLQSVPEPVSLVGFPLLGLGLFLNKTKALSNRNS